MTTTENRWQRSSEEQTRSKEGVKSRLKKETKQEIEKMSRQQETKKRVRKGKRNQPGQGDSEQGEYDPQEEAQEVEDLQATASLWL